MCACKLSRKRILAGMAMGALNFFAFFPALAYAWKDGILGPAPKYAWLVCSVLILGPGLFWLACSIRHIVKTRKDGRSLLTKILHGIIYVTSLPAGFALTFLATRLI